MDEVIIDVREKDEFEAEHIENSIHLPLSCFLIQAPGVLHALSGKNISLMCRSGNRAKLALRQAESLSSSDNRFEVFEGGIQEWKRQGKAVIGSGRASIPIMRQVMLVAGSLVLLAVILTFTVSSGFVWIAGFVGGGLAFAGATGFCPMAELLSKMPWNKMDVPSCPSRRVL